MYPFWRLNRMLYMPACRLHARHAVTDEGAGQSMVFLCSVEFLLVHRYWPDLVKPRTFSEKIWNRMLFQRDPRFVVLSDKLRARSFVAERAGEELLVPLHWSGKEPDEIPWDVLPSKFVIKATHGCGYNLFVTDKIHTDPKIVRSRMAKWLGVNYGRSFGLGTEWSYRHVPPYIIVEEYLQEGGHNIPDYKFWCFAGRVECVTVHSDRHSMHSVQTFDRSFRPYKFAFYLDAFNRTALPPPNFADMVRAAESLAAGFDFIRIDMYNVSGRIYAGEFTVYPGGGFIRFLPYELDLHLGTIWQLDKAAQPAALKRNERPCQ